MLLFWRVSVIHIFTRYRLRLNVDSFRLNETKLMGEGWRLTTFHNLPITYRIADLLPLVCASGVLTTFDQSHVRPHGGGTFVAVIKGAVTL
ncbi:unnamed protein product [Protopolystoma xenopodis]|uniref:Uncharacterized protein n=1 Tax=Protopolystoma xenopodis TaxID=117903 RepID=A0A448WSS0_9PLAT|nr:unnamed protein product [Protopolystoma xenopodis]